MKQHFHHPTYPAWLYDRWGGKTEADHHTLNLVTRRARYVASRFASMDDWWYPTAYPTTANALSCALWSLCLEQQLCEPLWNIVLDPGSWTLPSISSRSDWTSLCTRLLHHLRYSLREAGILNYIAILETRCYRHEGLVWLQPHWNILLWDRRFGEGDPDRWCGDVGWSRDRLAATFQQYGTNTRETVPRPIRCYSRHWEQGWASYHTKGTTPEDSNRGGRFCLSSIPAADIRRAFALTNARLPDVVHTGGVEQRCAVTSANALYQERYKHMEGWGRDRMWSEQRELLDRIT